MDKQVMLEWLDNEIVNDKIALNCHIKEGDVTSVVKHIRQEIKLLKAIRSIIEKYGDDNGE